MGNTVSTKRGHTGASVAQHLTDAIRRGGYAPGQRLVEADLTRELGVSRGPVREAFRKLGAEGLIENVPNRGAIVRRLSLCEAIELFEIRGELETYAAAKAATGVADPCVRERFERAIAPIWENSPRPNVTAYLEENRRFHEAILVAAGNIPLVSLHRQLQVSLILAQLGPALTADSIALSVKEHQAIARAILAQKPRRARKAMCRHLKRAKAMLAALPEHVFRREKAAVTTVG